MTIQEFKNHLIGQLHGGSLDKVRNFYQICERAEMTMLMKVDPLEAMRVLPLTNTVHDDVFNYFLPSDFNKIVDIYPQADRSNADKGLRVSARSFGLLKSLKDKRISIEGSGSSKIIKIDWDTNTPVIVHTMNTYDGNGTWTAVGTASGVATDTITKYSGGGSVTFDSAASGDGIQNTSFSDVDLTDEDEVGDFFVWFYIKDSTELAKLTNAICYWGNDLTANYWTGVAQTTQTDGTSFRVGWNLIKIPWSTATETGTVDPSAIDSFKITFTTTDAVSDIRVDNIVCSVGSAFDIKYYSKYLFKNSSETLISIPTDDSDEIILDNDSLQIFNLEVLKMCAQQIEGSDSTFDISYANSELPSLYMKYKNLNPSQAIKQTSSYGPQPNFRRYL